MTITDVLMILAVIVSPFLAVFVQRKIDIIRERRNQKLRVFRTLMATRANKISLEHVQALNSIELFFEKKGKEKKVIDKWSEYLDHLASAPKENDPEIGGHNTNFFPWRKNTNTRLTREPYVHPWDGQVTKMDGSLDDFLEYDFTMGSDVLKCPYYGADVPSSYLSLPFSESIGLRSKHLT